MLTSLFDTNSFFHRHEASIARWNHSIAFISGIFILYKLWQNTNRLAQMAKRNINFIISNTPIPALPNAETLTIVHACNENDEISRRLSHQKI